MGKEEYITNDTQFLGTCSKCNFVSKGISFVHNIDIQKYHHGYHDGTSEYHRYAPYIVIGYLWKFITWDLDHNTQG